MTLLSLADAFQINPSVRISKGTTTPFVAMEDLEPFRRDVNTSDERPYSGGAKFMPGDILMARITPSLENGKTSRYTSDNQKPAAGSTEFIVIRGREGVSDTSFAYYVFTSVEIREFAISQMNGSSGRQRVQTDSLATYLISLPPLAEQRGIAATLGALDDKIESNRRAIRLLLELSQTQFVKWKAELVDPKMVRFGDIADIFGGSTPMTSDPDLWGGGIQWVTPTDVTALSEPYLFETARTITTAGVASCSTKVHPPGTIFMTSRATIGAFAVNQEPCATNQGFIAVEPRAEFQRWFLFEEMRSRVSEFVDHSNGSTFLELSRGRFKALEVEIPATDSVVNLHNQLEGVHSKGVQLSREIRRLSDLRDTLLPELLSGRIRVPEAREAVEAIV